MENDEKKENKRKKGKEASVADFVICLLAYESGFFSISAFQIISEKEGRRIEAFW